MKKDLKFIAKVFLVVLIIYVFVSCATQKMIEEDSANTAQNKEIGRANDVKGKEEETPKMKYKLSEDKLWKSLKKPLKEWAPTSDEFEADDPTVTSLQEIWTADGSHPWQYIPKGANKLISEIQSDSFFSNCQKADSLELTMFKDKGEIQTVINLYDKLYYCDPDNRPSGGD